MPPACIALRSNAGRGNKSGEFKTRAPCRGDAAGTLRFTAEGRRGRAAERQSREDEPEQSPHLCSFAPLRHHRTFQDIRGRPPSPFSAAAISARDAATAFDAIASPGSDAATPAVVTATAFRADETPFSRTATPGRVTASAFCMTATVAEWLPGVSEAQAFEAEGLAGGAEDVPGVAVAGAGGL